MAPRFGLGPVFHLEWLAVPRRWQLYVGRVVFVAALLAMLWMVWQTFGADQLLTINTVKMLSTRFVALVVMIQLVAVMLAAPAIMAGSICVDKARGTLHHVFVTDLSNREIILGKLGARLLTILALMACGAPVLALGGLIGGVDYEALLRAYIVTVGVVILSCSLSMMFSLWAKKPHQALLPTFAFLGLWCAFPWLIAILLSFSGASPDATLQSWLVTNPFYAVTASYAEDDPTRWIQPLVFLAVMLTLSAVIVIYTMTNLRRVVIGQANRGVKKQKADAPLRVLDYLPGPALDGNPVLWREWHRKKPTKWTGRFWTLYGVFSLLASGFVLLSYFTNPGGAGPKELAATVNGAEVAIGLLLLTISATSALAEERDRGSLDVIMTTPLPTGSILWGKWWGTFAIVPRMAILPIWVSLAMAMVSGAWLAPIVLIGLILAYSAFITSLGLGLAIWVPRLGRAIAVGITVVLLLNLALHLAHSYMMRQDQTVQSTVLFANRPGTVMVFDMYERERPDWDWLLLGNPFNGIYETTHWSGELKRNEIFGPVYRFHVTQDYGWVLIWMGILGGLATLLMTAAIATFDRCLGRMTTHPRVDSPPRVDPAFPSANSKSLMREV